MGEASVLPDHVPGPGPEPIGVPPPPPPEIPLERAGCRLCASFPLRRSEYSQCQ
jgi:hypothetical protein